MTGFSTTLAVLGTTVPGLSDVHESDLIAWLLILLLGIALGIGITGLLLVVHFARHGRVVAPHRGRRSPRASSPRRTEVPLFPMPNRWLAIKSGNPMFIQAALGLHNPIPCSWEEGLSVAQEKRLFVSPPISGWVLVIGARLPDPGDDVDRLYRFLLELSRKVGHVQFFSLNRVVHHHAWVHAHDGRIVRAYAWAGRTLWNQGKLSKAEHDLSLKCFNYLDAPDPVDFGESDPTVLNTERVPLLASRWSVDPMSIDTRMLRENQGIAGQLSRSRAG